MRIGLETIAKEHEDRFRNQRARWLETIAKEHDEPKTRRGRRQCPAKDQIDIEKKIKNLIKSYKIVA